MQKDLFYNRPYPVKADDLKFDGKNLIIPSYYTSVILDYLKTTDIHDMNEADKEDFKAFKNFLYDVEEYSNKGN
ncbi:MAG: hypothetical protein ACO25K_06720 [Candidatus Fonsibacter ubiquis]|jgi:hypothetical protein